jgi:hypothetical protein
MSLSYWALPLAISWRGSRNRNESAKKYGYYDKLDLYLGVDFLCFQIQLTYDAAGIEFMNEAVDLD